VSGSRWAAAHPAWRLGFADAGWWRRLAAPALHAWAAGARPWRRVDQAVATDDPDKQARACSGVLLPATKAGWLRFLDGRPVSAVTITVRQGWCEEAAARGQAALLLVWANASWHVRKAVRTWVRDHKRRVKASGQGVRRIVCQLPIKRPGLNPIEPKWRHRKGRVIAPARRRPAHELAARVCDALACAYHDPIPIPQPVP